MATTDARQIAITEVAKGSPADGVLAVGDVILGVGGQAVLPRPAHRVRQGPDHRRVRGRRRQARAHPLARRQDGGGDGEASRARQPTAPPRPTTARSRSASSSRAARRWRSASPDPATSENPITRSLNALALLASGNPEIPPAGQEGGRVGGGLLDRRIGRPGTTAMSSCCSPSTRWPPATTRCMPGLRRLALEAANGPEHRRLVGPPLRRTRRPPRRLRDDERPGRAADDLPGDGPRRGRR